MCTRRPKVVMVLAILALVMGACSSGSTESAGAEQSDQAMSEPATEESAAVDEHTEAAAVDEHSEMAMADEHASEGFVFGEPADPADADRTVQITARDEFVFEPPTVEVRAGEVITFEVDNAGQLPHDFTLGDEAAQEEHAREMEEMGAEMAHTDPNAMTIEPGETASMTWRFTEGGEVLYGCHQPGHYDAGMVGTVEVAG